MDTRLEKFNPLISELRSAIAVGQGVDPNDLEAVKKAQFRLRDLRNEIARIGKELRDEANAWNKAVLAKEKKLVKDISDEEDRLKAIREEAARKKEIERRKASLPKRIARLDAIEVSLTEEQILELDDEQFETFYNKCVADRNAKKEAEIAERERAVREAEEKSKREAEMREREERARAEERERIERDRIEAEKRRERETKEREEQAERARLAKEEMDREQARRVEEARKAEEERLARDQKYQMFLAAHGVTKEGLEAGLFIEMRETGRVVIYKRLAELEI